jgi:hypothetical protein
MSLIDEFLSELSNIKNRNKAIRDILEKSEERGQKLYDALKIVKPDHKLIEEFKKCYEINYDEIPF